MHKYIISFTLEPCLQVDLMELRHPYKQTLNFNLEYGGENLQHSILRLMLYNAALLLYCWISMLGNFHSWNFLHTWEKTAVNDTVLLLMTTMCAISNILFLLLCFINILTHIVHTHTRNNIVLSCRDIPIQFFVVSLINFTGPLFVLAAFFEHSRAWIMTVFLFQVSIVGDLYS